jgi:hypothetical protein
MKIFSEYLHKYMFPDEPSKQLLDTCHGENSLRINEQVVSYFPKCVYNGLEDLADIYEPCRLPFFKSTKASSR